MSALMPPQARAAITAARVLSKAAERGTPALRSALRTVRGPGKRRLAKVLAPDARKVPAARAAFARPMPEPAPVPYAERELDEGELDEGELDEGELDDEGGELDDGEG